MDLLSSDTSSTSSSPSPASPSALLSTMPEVGIASQDGDSFFNFLEDEFTKDTSMLPPPPPSSSGLPYDFFGAFGSIGGSTSSLVDSPEPILPSPHYAIDPLLTGTPSTSKALSDFGDDDDDEAEEEDSIVQPVKVGGKGKLRKGTVASGGIVKKSSGVTKDKENTGPRRNIISSVVATGPRNESDPPDEWRPTPEEYKKMSSKEKRQLRNKISARNFRVRRKEYISTLEADISERDRLLAAIRAELGSTQSENLALRQEITLLKKALIDGRGAPDTPVLPPPAPLTTAPPAVPAPTTASASTSANSSSPLLTPNTQKDLAASSRNPRAFWGGIGGGLSGFTPVHTTLVPDMNMVFGSSLSRKGLLENMNPALNARLRSPSPGPQQQQGLDGFLDQNGFTYKTLEAHRMQLWQRMGAQQYQYQQNIKASTPSQSPPPQPLTGLAANLRRHFFQHPEPSVLAGKGTASPSTRPLPLGNATNTPSTSNLQPTKDQAALAAMASQTLMGRLGSAFWDAFSGSTPGSGSGFANGGGKAWDAEKVRKVLDGSAVVRVVDVDPEPTSRVAVPAPVSKTLPVSPSSTSSPASSCLTTAKDKCLNDLLEGMSGLSLGKK